MRKIMPLPAVVLVYLSFIPSALADDKKADDVDAAILEALAAIDRAEDAIKAPDTAKRASDAVKMHAAAKNTVEGVKTPAHVEDIAKFSDKGENLADTLRDRKSPGNGSKDRLIDEENAVLLSSLAPDNATSESKLPQKALPAVSNEVYAKSDTTETPREKSVNNAKRDNSPKSKRISDSDAIKSRNFNASASLAFVSEIYRLNGVDFQKKIPKKDLRIVDLFQYAYDHKLVYRNTKPAVGDLAFFHNTYDRNGDGRRNDWYSTVGIVESVEDNGNIFVLFYVSDRIMRIVMNLKHPQALSSDNMNKAQNSILRPDGAAPAGSASKLFAGFGNLLKDKKRVVVVDNWHPGMRLEMR